LVLVRLLRLKGAMTTFGRVRSTDSADQGGTLAGWRYRPPGVPASGAIVFSSLFVLFGLGVGGFVGLHAYVHRNDSARRNEDPTLLPVATPSSGNLPAAQPSVTSVSAPESGETPAATAPPAGSARISESLSDDHAR
jgi:hypothetical protein